MSDILVAYYSRTGKTRLVAEKLASLLGADLEEITETKDRSGVIGFIAAGKDTVMKKPAELAHAPSPGEHKTVVIGMPVWANQPPPAIRTWLGQTDLAGRTVCAFCTSGGGGGKKTFAVLNELLPQGVAETFHWKKPKAGDPELDRQLAEWAERVKAVAAP